jgi:hypothetical protein
MIELLKPRKVGFFTGNTNNFASEISTAKSVGCRSDKAEVDSSNLSAPTGGNA